VSTQDKPRWVRHNHPVDYEQLAAQLIRAVRGRRSQLQASRLLGARSNIVHNWEAGRAFPTAALFYRFVEKMTRRSRPSIEHFYQRTPSWLDDASPQAPEGIVRLLDDLRASRALQDIARATGHSRFAVGRWLKGQAEPRLPDFLRLIDAISLRLLDFLEGLVDPARLPAVADDWSTLQAARRAAYDCPWSHAVLRVLELEDYRQLSRHRAGYIARRLGITRAQETEALELLAASRQVRRRGGRWQPTGSMLVDTRRDALGAKRAREFWTQVVQERLRADQSTILAYNLFAVSRADLTKIRELERTFFRDLRQIVAQSTPSQVVSLVVLGHVDFNDGAGEA
jgi:DNA-binding phage protein